MLTSDTFLFAFHRRARRAHCYYVHYFTPGWNWFFWSRFPGYWSSLCFVSGVRGKHGTIDGLLGLVTVSAIRDIYIPLMEVMTRGHRVKYSTMLFVY